MWTTSLTPPEAHHEPQPEASAKPIVPAGGDTNHRRGRAPVHVAGGLD